MPWGQDYDLLKQLESQIVTQRSKASPRPPTEPTPSTAAPPGSAHPIATSSTWRGQVNAFNGWGQKSATRLSAHLAESVQLSRGDPPEDETGYRHDKNTNPGHRGSDLATLLRRS